ncbi:protein NLRC5-like [Sinocyclocheilus rhinocerous]|nr:PREDICTED: protein NLRC5-like [Sinocyclocheilus rhinocerous]
MKVECTNLFQPGKDKKIKTVLTKGVAGIGKSVSVQKFVVDWAEEKENQDISFVFPLPFREMNLKEEENQSLMSLVSQFFPETKGLNLTRRNQFKVLFILDGLDECRLPLNFEGNETWRDVSSPASLDVLLTNLIKGNLLPSALIWITTRPAAASKIPPDCIDRVTEVRGFNDAQKEEYFRKRFTDQNLASEIIDHVKKSKSLFIMCHIPVFCWISATVLQNILEEKRNNDLKNNQADDASKILQESNTEDIPKTLTQMYTHFLRFQIQQSRRKYDGEYTPDVSWDKDAILSLGKLAFHQLERNNLIFYDTDLETCGIDIYKASVYSGMCTQIFKEETGIILGTMYCFVHLSIQEFIAALYAHLFLDINKKSVFFQDSTVQENKNEAMIDLLKTAVDKALESDNGHLDLFLRFLLGLSLQSNQRLLQGLLTQQNRNEQSTKEIVQYIKHIKLDNLSPERSINLFYCLNELNDLNDQKEIQTHLNKGSLSSSDLSPAQWSALVFVLLTSEEELEEFELQKFKKSDECLIRLSAVIKTSKRALLNDCNLTDKSCPALATVLGSDTSLKELNMNNNNLQDSGVIHLCTGLKSVNCKLEILSVLQNILEEKRNNVVKNNQADDASKTLQESNTEDTPKTLTQMYTHFLRFQIQQSRRKYDGEYTPDVSWDKDAIFSLGKLAFDQLERNNVIFYDTDLEACGIDVYKASVYSGMCTQIFKEETGIVLGTMYCFVHLSIQEFIAALYAHLVLDINKKSVFFQDSTVQENKNEAMPDLLKTAVDKALESDNGHLDLFLRFLLGLSLQSNQRLLQGLLTQQNRNEQSKKEIVKYIKQQFEANLSPERSINLFYCLNELNDQTLVKDIQTHLSKGSLSSADLSPAQWSALVFVLLTSEEELEEFELQKFKKSDECLIRLSAVIKTTKRALLNDCNLTDKSCPALATVLGSDTSLKELNMNNNNLQDSGVIHLCTGLKSVNCKLEILRFLKSAAAQEACDYLTEVLGTSPLVLKELDLSEVKLGDLDGGKLSALFMDSHSKLEKIKLNNCRLTEKSCSVLATVLSSKTILKEMNLNNSRLLDSGVKEICEGLKNSVCELKILKLSDCSITEEGYLALASALKSNPSHLIELDLTGNDPGQSGVKELNDLLQDPNNQLKTLRFLGPVADEACQYVTGIVGKNPLLLRELNLSLHELGDTRVNQIAALLRDKHCKLNTLMLCDCGLTDESCSALATVLRSNSSLKELDLSNNNLLDSGVKKLQNGLENTNCTLENLRLSNCGISEEGYKALASALRSNPSHLIELDLTGNDPGQSGVKELNDLLQDPNCQLKTLRFLSLAADEACQFLTGVMCKNPLLLRELNLSERELGDTRVIQIAALLQDKHCKLNTLILCRCSITEKQCLILTSALKLNPSLLRELDLSENELKNTGVNHLCDILKDSHCKLERLRLSDCSISEESYKALASAVRSNPSHLIELDLTGNDPGQSGVKQLSDLLQDPNCWLKTLRFLGPAADEACQYATEVQGENPLLLRELNLSLHELGDTRVNQIAALLQDKHCKLNTLTLWDCSITEKQCLILTSALKSNPSHLRELDLSGNKIENTGVNHLCDVLKDSHCKLEQLRLSCCYMTDEGYSALTSALKSNPSHLRELNLSGNKLGDSGVKNLSDLLMNPQFKLEKLHLCECSITEKQCLILTSALKTNPSHLRELDLSRNELKNTGVNHLCDVLKDSHCKLERLRLRYCYMTDEGSSAVTSALKSNPSHLRELDLRMNELGDSGVKNLSDLLMNPQYKLEILDLSECSITHEQGLILTSALKSNPSHLRELNLSENQIKNTGMSHLCDVLNDSHCKLETLRLNFCGITDVSALTNAKALQFLKQLDLRNNMIGDSVKQLIHVLQDSNCELRLDREQPLFRAATKHTGMHFTSWSKS